MAGAWEVLVLFLCSSDLRHTPVLAKPCADASSVGTSGWRAAGRAGLEPVAVTAVIQRGAGAYAGFHRTFFKVWELRPPA